MCKKSVLANAFNQLHSDAVVSLITIDETDSYKESKLKSKAQLQL